MSVSEVREVIDKYIQLVITQEFIMHQKGFAQRIQTGLVNEYKHKQKLSEPDMVESIVNSVRNFKISVNGFNISTNSIYIHNRIRVKFECYGTQKSRELGDLIFILSIVYKNKKYFEKLTISQSKKDSTGKKGSTGKSPGFSIDMGQLYLLSRFPPFRRASGPLDPNIEYNLPDYSGCLGSYNLLFYPGDFIFMSAKWLEILLAGRKSIGLKELDNKINLCFPYRKSYKIGILDIFSFPCCASNIYDFTDKYLRGYIGELIYSGVGFYNDYARKFLKDLLLRIKDRAKRKGEQNIVDFVDSFFSYPYAHNFNGKDDGGNLESDSEGGGFGIIHTTINLGEGKG